jgi:hypothetical protein
MKPETQQLPSEKEDLKFFFRFGQILTELNAHGVLPINKQQRSAVDDYIKKKTGKYSGVAQINHYDVLIQLFICYCARVRKGNLTDDLGTVWISKKHNDGRLVDNNGFFLGLGTKPGQQIRFWLPMDQWEQVEFAKELKEAPVGEEVSPQEAITFLMSQV